MSTPECVDFSQLAPYPPPQAIITFNACYKSPDDEDGPTNLVNVIVQQNTAPGGVDDDQQMLLDIEQNIANLEKSLQKGKEGQEVLRLLC